MRFWLHGLLESETIRTSQASRIGRSLVDVRSRFTQFVALCVLCGVADWWAGRRAESAPSTGTFRARIRLVGHLRNNCTSRAATTAVPPLDSSTSSLPPTTSDYSTATPPITSSSSSSSSSPSPTAPTTADQATITHTTNPAQPLQLPPLPSTSAMSIKTTLALNATAPSPHT
nr:unnamed protein product [Spirometra erinaceieuropaei]